MYIQLLEYSNFFSVTHRGDPLPRLFSNGDISETKRGTGARSVSKTQISFCPQNLKMVAQSFCHILFPSIISLAPTIFSPNFAQNIFLPPPKMILHQFFRVNKCFHRFCACVSQSQLEVLAECAHQPHKLIADKV